MVAVKELIKGAPREKRMMKAHKCMQFFLSSPSDFRDDNWVLKENPNVIHFRSQGAEFWNIDGSYKTMTQMRGEGLEKKGQPLPL